ncbi:MAG TPA: heparinase II/III family protein [Bacteroidales bacterium]|nr:heparinase II/III family protein [Bacteroidales bacterium]HPJ60041.1 heparinase II/III family protein [Bacteroidales bacterium]HPR11460.1 heparinase II/III family protein [Bacteroidales bacterium]HRW86115.1 heparinase II/III family protein [Bacteroidales bacterium]
MMVFFIVLILISMGFTHNSDGHLCVAGEHPALIITRTNLDDFISNSKTTHKDLYGQAINLADDFLSGDIPGMKNASNNYRVLGETMPSLGLAWLMTKDKKYLEGGVKWINALLEVRSWNGSENLGRSAWTTGIAQLYDWLYDDLDPALREKIITRLKNECKEIIRTAAATRALSNHLLIETSAVGTTGLILPDDDPMKKVLLEQADKWTNYIIGNAPLDGSWGEGIQYWEYGLGYFLRFLEGARTAGYRDYFNGYEWLKKTGRFLIHFSLPGNLTKVINFGDCGSDRYIPAFLLYLPAAKYRDPAVQDYAIKIQAESPHKFSWLDFLTYDHSLKPVDFRSVESEFHHFEDHGFVCMRSSWDEDATLVGFRCGPAPGHANQAKPERIANRGYGPGHQHPDINNFVIFANGTWLAIDPGYVYLKETRNHNTVLVNNAGQAGAGGKWLDYMAFESREPAPKIVHAESSPRYDYVIGDAGNIYTDEAELEHFERHLMFIKPDIIIIADILRGKRNSTFSWLLHANEIATVKKLSSDFEISKNEASLSVFPLMPADIETDVSERLLRGSDVYGIADSNRTEARLRTITLNSTGKNTSFLVVMTVNKPGGEKPTVTFDKGMIGILRDGRGIRIKYQPVDIAGSKILEVAE